MDKIFAPYTLRIYHFQLGNPTGRLPNQQGEALAKERASLNVVRQ
jgi:hypothetical protein